jgi:hypothetical protein
MYRCLQFAVLLLLAAMAVAQQPEQSPSGFKVKYVDVNTVYLEAGKSAGLAPGMSLTVKRSRVLSSYSGDGQVRGNLIVAKLTVVSVSNNSAMCEVRSQTGDVRRGDLAFMPNPEREPSPMEARTPIFKPAINEIDSEHEQRAPNTTAVASTPTIATSASTASGTKPAPGISIADAARANRNHTLSSRRSATPSVQANIPPESGPAPSTATTHAAAAPSATAAATQIASSKAAGSTPTAVAPATAPAAPQVEAKSEPLSLGEIARRNRNKHLPANTAVTSDKPTVAAAAAPAAPSSGDATPAASLPTVADARSTSSFPAPSALPKTEPPASQQPAIALVGAANKPGSAAASNTAEPASIKTRDVRLATSTAAPKPSIDAKPASSTPTTTTAITESSRVVASTAGPASPEVASATPPFPVAPPAAAAMSANVPAPVSSAAMPTSPAPVKADFRVKYVAEDAIYIEGGKDAGLVAGMSLSVNRSTASSPEPQTIAEVTVVSVSNTSAVCEIKGKTADIQRGDIALLSQADQQNIVDARTLAPNRKYPVVIAFSEGDPLDEEAREAVPKPPSPEVNRARGRIGVDYSFINTRGAGVDTTTMQTGGVVRVDMSRIAGSYWNLNGYWRGRLNLSNSSAQQQSVYDLVNRTYTIGFTYLNPNSHWTAGVGRLYLPWATSLDTIDGGYLGFKVGKHTTVGAFAGTTPDPASFDYNQDRRLAGSFVAFEGGSFDHLRFTSTEGVAVSAIEWREDRQFIFSENGLFYKRFLSIYHSAQADIQRLPTGGTTEGLSRSFATLRLQPFSRFSIDVNHNYFRDVPTFDPSLVGTGLLDKFLFQGVSVGGRLELPGRISLYNNIGQSNSSADAHSSLNQMYGITLGRLWRTGLRGDIRYSKFNSSFGQGNYRAASLSRNFSEKFRIELNAGQQAFVSSLGVPTNYRLLGSTVDVNLGGHYFIESAFNLQRSLQQNFDQFITTFGYRFDSGRH